jgi:translation initiation factor IF-3
MGREVMEKFAETVKEFGKVDRPPVMEGRTMSMILVPHKK